MNKNPNEKQINLRDVWQMVKKRKWLLIIPMVLAVIAAYAGSFLLTERYQSRASILVKESEVLGPAVRALTSGSSSDAIRSEVDLRLWQQSVRSELLSPATLIRVIAELDLASDPGLRSEADELASSFPQYSREELTNIMLVRKLQEEIVKVGFIGQNLITIMCESEDPLKARKMAETLANIFREEQVKEDLLRIRAMQEFTTEQLTIYKKEWEDAEENLAEFKKSYTRASVNQKVGEGVLDGLTAEADQSELTMEDLADQRAFAVRSLLSAGVDTSALLYSDELSSELIALGNLTKQKASLMEKYVRTDPKVLEVIGRLNSELDSLHSVSDRATLRLGFSEGDHAFKLVSDYLALTARVDLAVQEKITLDNSAEKLKTRYTTWPDFESELKSREEKAATKKDIYLRFNAQLLGSRIDEDAFRKEAESRYKLIEPATLPLKPVYPDRIRILALGCALGLVLGFGAVLAAEILDNSLRSIQDTEAYLGLKVLGTVPRIERKKGVRPELRVKAKPKPVEVRR